METLGSATRPAPIHQGHQACLPLGEPCPLKEGGSLWLKALLLGVRVFHGGHCQPGQSTACWEGCSI